MSEQQRSFSPGFTANYRGDVRHIVGEVKGPNTMGEFFRAVDAVFDGERTKVTFDLVRADEAAS